MLVQFSSVHLDGMVFEPEAAEELRKPGALGRLECLADLGLCMTVFAGKGEAVGIVAALPGAPGACEVLVMSTPAQKRFPVRFTKDVREALVTIRQHFVKITAIGEDTEFCKRWFSWLGFSCDGPISRPEFGGARMMMWEMRA